MFLISLCTVFTFFILYLGYQRQRMVTGSPLGFRQDVRYLPGKGICTAFVLILVAVSTVRYGFIDTYAYKIMYRMSRHNLAYVNSAPWGVEAGWLYFLYLLNFISDNPKLMLFVSALIINAAYAHISREYSAEPLLSMLIYFCLMYMDTNNGLRQMVAAALIVFAFPYLVRKKYIRYLLFVALAYQFHESSVVCVLIAIAVVGKPLNIRTIGCLCIGVLMLLAPSSVNGFIGSTFDESKYGFYLDFQSEYGMSFIRAVVIGILPCVLAIWYVFRCRRRRIQICKAEAMLLNMLFVNTMFVLMGMYMQYWNRFTFYTIFAPIVLMPKLAYETIGRGNYKRLIRPVMIGCYVFFFAYNMYKNMIYGALDQFYIDVAFFQMI